jgi:NADPH:quinone reductase
MRALLCTHFGPPEEMVLSDVPPPSPAPGQALVAIKACGVNFPDALMLQDKYQRKPPLPFAPGGEIAGVIEALGAGVEDFAVGDRICAWTTYGGFAEQIAIDAANLVKMPPGVTFPQAASFIIAHGSAYHALKDRGRLRAGEALVVLGAAGGVGLAAVELGRLMGARVIAACSTPEKLTAAREAGGVDGFVYPRTPLDEEARKHITFEIRRLTDGGADVLFDPIGDEYAEPAVRAMAWGGRYLIVGFAAGQIPAIRLNLALLKGCEIVGVNWGGSFTHEPALAMRNLRELAEWIGQGRLSPHISATFALEDGAKAIRMLLDRQATGKVIVTP